MAQVVPVIQKPEEDDGHNIRAGTEPLPSSAHLQTTVSERQPDGTEGPLGALTTSFQTANWPRDSPASNRTPFSESPDRLSPHAAAGREQGPWKFPKPGSRLADTGPGDDASASPQNLSVANTEISGSLTRPAAQGRKSVQFTRGAEDGENNSPGARTPADEERAESGKPQSLYSKLRALASSQSFVHARTPSTNSIGARSNDGRDQEGSTTPRGRNETGLEAMVEEDGSDIDADAEESAAEGILGQSEPRKRRRRFRRNNDSATAPSSPLTPIALFHSNQSPDTPPVPRPAIFRSATDGEMARQGVSEDEARRQLTSPWTPKHPLRGLSYGGQRRNNDGTPEGRETRRPLGLLNLAGITSSRGEGATSATPDGDGTPKASRRKQLTERGTTLSAAKWRQIKNSLKLLGQTRRKERTQDQQKSAELLAELAAGSPAALMIASMFQRDEHGSKRIPVLLEQLKVSITDSEVVKYKEANNPTPNDRHIIFRIELEYGNGINRMKWIIRRSLADFASLHAKYKLHFTSQRLKGRGKDSKKLPRFPREAFPYIKSLGWYKGIEDEEGEEDAVNEPDGAMTDTEGRPGFGRHRSRASIGTPFRRISIGSQADNGPQTPGGTNMAANRDARYSERQRKKLEKYLQRMIQFMLFRPDANRLCKFLEVSALGMRLAAEGSYHGKEGFLVIRSAKGLDFRKALTPSNVKTRHTPKWFLVRHSYIVCVDSPEEMHIYDVFLFDSDFRIQTSRFRKDDKDSKEAHSAKALAASAKESAKHPQHHRLKIYNSERKLKLIARNERQLQQFEESMRLMVDNSPWTKQNRFDSFAPVRPNCFAQWLVDGRDHMWVVSRALNQAKDVIYIHDWWLSPELYMRRPPAISQKWRLDRLLKRKAEQGVKVFIIVYRNIDAAIPIDSQYTKFSLLDLHPNIFVQRSPNQFRQNTFFWAHHEKLCIVDHTLAFVGGIDLCFGRWDTPQHILTDDKPTGFDASQAPKDADHCQLWPGKDYSNPRIQDFYALNKPYEEMYDRSQVARMPWHDISMQVVGQPARDLTRHFVQRWNYILRQRKPTRPTPFLLPPPDFNAADLEALGLDGTCEVQMLRSAGPWSLGTPDRTEHSIMNAYVKMIEESEHFVYMENQFFISSCETESATVHNKIGDALVERIGRAYKEDQHWRAVIVIPLIPGFQNTVEQEGGTSVRLIMQYQYRSICRGETSIFGRLKAQGIEPEDYIQFYSLRQWGKIGPKQNLVTEQLYIHAKCIIVDDRVALIGSANINERSMLGNRDSECAAVVRDTDMLWSSMNGKPYRVARFAHTLRMRLMREHLGLDVDQIMEEAQVLENEHLRHMGKEPDHRPNTAGGDDMDAADAERGDEFGAVKDRTKEIRAGLLYRSEQLASFNHDVDWEQADNPNLRANRKLTEDSRVTNNPAHRADIAGEGFDHMADMEKKGLGGGRDTAVTHNGKEVLINEIDTQGMHSLKHPRGHGDHIRMPSYVFKQEAPEPPLPPRPSLVRMSTEKLGLPLVATLPSLPDLDDTDIGGPALIPVVSRSSGTSRHPLFNELKKAMIDRDCMQDPVTDKFIDDVWHLVAENNTKIYRAVFRCQPDNQVRDWNEYHQYEAYAHRFNQLQGKDDSDGKIAPPPDDRPVSRTGPPGVGAGAQAVGIAKLKSLNKVPTDIEKGATFMKDKIKGALDDIDQDQAAVEKSALRNWAAEANRRQMERTGTDLSLRKGDRPLSNEKSGLLPVPEDEQPPTRSSDGSETQRVGSSQSATPQEKTTLPDFTNSTSQPPQVRRRRATTRSSRRDFNASDDILSLVEAEELLQNVQGHLIEWPYDWYVVSVGLLSFAFLLTDV